MTECERIIADGILPESFFEEEVRCDFLVTKERKKIWAVELDLLLKFDAVCKKHGLTYFLMFGSLLGAVRHQGFVPWDDDVDVAMPRKDYQTLLELKDEFPAPYFLQTPYTDEGYYYSFAKIRNGNTTAMSRKFSYNTFNQGIFLDIFPLDLIPDTFGEEEYQLIDKLNKDNSSYMRRDNPFLDENDIKRVSSIGGVDPLKTWEQIQGVATSHGKSIQGNRLATAVSTIYPLEKSAFGQRLFKEARFLQFEGHEFPVPTGYEEVLKIIYGDYMTFPPVEKRGIWHDGTLFDPDQPYECCLSENTQGR